MTEVTPDNAASAPVHRYEIYADRSADGGVCLETDLDNEGEWVRYEAHAATVTALEAEVRELENQINSVIEFLSHFASVHSKGDETWADTVMNGITELTTTIGAGQERGLKILEAAESIDGSWDALMDTQQVIPVSITKLRTLREALTGAGAK